MTGLRGLRSAVAFAALHTVPHAPQFLRSLCTAVHALPQHFSPAAQRASSLQPRAQTVCPRPSDLQMFPVGQSPSTRQTTHLPPAEQNGV